MLTHLHILEALKLGIASLKDLFILSTADAECSPLESISPVVDPEIIALRDRINTFRDTSAEIEDSLAIFYADETLILDGIFVRSRKKLQELNDAFDEIHFPANLPPKVLSEAEQKKLNTRLIKQSRTNKCSKVQELLDQGADPNAKDSNGRSALSFACSRGVASLLIKHGADLDLQSAEGLTPLMFVLNRKPHSVASLLIEMGADVNAADFHGRNALMHLYDSKHLEIPSLLIEKGIDVNSRENVGKTELMYFPTNRVAALLIVNGADATAKDSTGRTVWHHISPHRNLFSGDSAYVDTIAALIDAEADVNAQDDAGVSLLMMCAASDRPEVCFYLVLNGADPLLAEGNDVTALNAYGRHFDIVDEEYNGPVWCRPENKNDSTDELEEWCP